MFPPSGSLPYGRNSSSAVVSAWLHDERGSGSSRYRVATATEIELPREFDDYLIGRELGRGATGWVYLAEDAMLARQVAIKFIANFDPAARQRFLLEARAVAQIHHPNVVSVYRVGTLG